MPGRARTANGGDATLTLRLTSQLNFEGQARFNFDRVNSTSVKRTTLELQLRGAACMLPLRQPSLLLLLGWPPV